MAKKKKDKDPQTQKQRSNIIAKPSFRAKGGNGNYTISDCLIYQDGRIATGVNVQFLVTKAGCTTEDVYIESDPSGYVTHKLAFTEPSCEITIQGPGFQQELNLLGPPKYKNPLKWENPPDAEIEKGVWAIFSWTFGRIKKWFTDKEVKS